MEKVKNRVYLNIVRDFDEKWIGLVFEAWKVNIPIKSLDYMKKISMLEKKFEIENIHHKGSYVQLELHKYQNEYVNSIAYLKDLINGYSKSLEEALNRAGIYEFDIIFDFYLNHVAYWISIEEGKKEVVA